MRGSYNKGEKNPMYGKTHTKATRKKMSEAKKRMFKEHPEKYKELSEWRKQYVKDHPEIKKTFSEGAKKQWTDPMLREKQFKAFRKAHSKKSRKEKARKHALEQWKDPQYVESRMAKIRERADKVKLQNAAKHKAVADKKANKEVDVQSHFYLKERDYLYKICCDIMGEYDLVPLYHQPYSYYAEIIEHFRPGWLALDRRRRYGYDPLNPED